MSLAPLGLLVQTKHAGQNILCMSRFICCMQDTSIVPETIEKQPPKLLEIPSSPVEKPIVPEPQEAEHQLSVDEMIVLDEDKNDEQEVAEDSILPEKKPKMELPAPRDQVWI